MNRILAALLLLAATGAFAGDALFDGAPSKKPVLPPTPPAPAAPAAAPVKAAPTPVPKDLAAARSRVGIDAQLARLSSVPADADFTFGVLGDAEPGRFPWERVFSPGPNVFQDELAALDAARPDFVFQLGDFVSKGTPGNYRAHVAYLDAHPGAPLLRCVGNHDRSRPNGDADKNLYDAVFGPRDYYFDHGGWRFISLDSSDRVVTPAQIAWLEGALNSPLKKVLFTHVPPAYLRHVKPLKEVGALEEWKASAQDVEAQRTALEDFFTNYFDEGSADFERLVERGGVKAVYMGHIHAFWAADHNGIRYVISGGGGSPLYPLPPGYPKKRFAHYLTVAATPAGLTETVHPYHGAPFVLPPVQP